MILEFEQTPALLMSPHILKAPPNLPAPVTPRRQQPGDPKHPRLLDSTFPEY